MAKDGTNPVVRVLIALLVVVAVALVAFFVGYLIGIRLAGVLPPDSLGGLVRVL
ncbi:MAG TPA: hypothetical protein PLB30_05890 [Thermoleophilia bacterium]|nr:hypothetical protein [Thermoleophilia bacterium]HQG03543.1 hypothetical protein [Thermoleophilia bacterium]HQG54680.1 hypothetical protein [Thermoleophilia bacterium]HQJ98061.1 hypothetical protein [Thermoleophilia bacterium]